MGNGTCHPRVLPCVSYMPHGKHSDDSEPDDLVPPLPSHLAATQQTYVYVRGLFYDPAYVCGMELMLMQATARLNLLRLDCDGKEKTMEAKLSAQEKLCIQYLDTADSSRAV